MNGPLSVKCRACGAERGSRCVSGSGAVRWVSHAIRRREADRALSRDGGERARKVDLVAIEAGALCAQERALAELPPGKPPIDEWRVAVVCACVFRTTSVRGEPVARELLTAHATPLRMAMVRRQVLRERLTALGLSALRAQLIHEASYDALHAPERLSRGGSYQAQAIRLIARRDAQVLPDDAVLRAVRLRYLREGLDGHS